MELTLDIGSDIHDLLLDLTQKKGKKLEVIAAEMLSLGARITAQSEEQSIDKVSQLLLKNTCQSNEILMELLHHVFQKEKSKLNAFDADTALSMIERSTNILIKRVL